MRVPEVHVGEEVAEQQHEVGPGVGDPLDQGADPAQPDPGRAGVQVG